MRTPCFTVHEFTANWTRDITHRVDFSERFIDRPQTPQFINGENGGLNFQHRFFFDMIDPHTAAAWANIHLALTLQCNGERMRTLRAF
jgi:hypothetical protein